MANTSRRFPVPSLTDYQLTVARARLLAAGHTGESLHRVLSLLLNLLRDEDNSQSYVFGREEIARIARVSTPTVDLLREVECPFMFPEKLPASAVAIYRALQAVSEFLITVALADPLKGRHWLGNSLDGEAFAKICAPLFEIRDSLRPDQIPFAFMGEDGFLHLCRAGRSDGIQVFGTATINEHGWIIGLGSPLKEVEAGWDWTITGPVYVGVGRATENAQERHRLDVVDSLGNFHRTSTLDLDLDEREGIFIFTRLRYSPRSKALLFRHQRNGTLACEIRLPVRGLEHGLTID